MHPTGEDRFLKAKLRYHYQKEESQADEKMDFRLG